MAEREDPLKQLLAELDELRTLLSHTRAAGNSAQKHSPARGVPNPFVAAAARLTAIRSATHRLAQQVSALQARVEAAEREVWQQKAKRADATARWKRSERTLNAIQESGIWKSIKPLWKLLHARVSPSAPAAPAGDFAFALDEPKEWQTGSEILFIRGWCLSLSGREIAAVRGKVGKKGRIGSYGIERADVTAAVDPSRLSSRCGFTIEMPVPVGSSKLRLEAIVQGGDWELFYEHEFTRTQTAADAALERALQAHQPSAPQPVEPLPRYPGISARRAIELLREHLPDAPRRDAAAAPFFSIITPVFNTKPQWLAEAALTVFGQSTTDWEWCLVDDGSSDPETRQVMDYLRSASPSVRVQFSANGGISAATNQGLDLATGEYVCFLDHDDLLASDALERMREALSDGFDAAYSDEDKLEDSSGRRVDAFHKPDWSPEYFRGVMYVGHLLCVRRALAQQVRFNGEFDGVQDFEFMLRVAETGAKIGHVPRILYHWRKTAGSIAAKSDAKSGIDALQARAVNAHMQRLGLPARAETKLPHRLRMIPLPREHNPRVSIIIPSRDAPEHLSRCLGSIFGITSYRDFEVIVIDNETVDPNALRILSEYPVRRIPFPGTFNFSRANNRGVDAASGQFLVFLNNDTEIITSDWLQHLRYYAEQEEVGAAGALLVYENRTVQHGGVVLGIRGTADHAMRNFPLGVDGYAGSLASAREVSAVTAACMMMRTSLFHEVGGFNEHFFTAYQDLDLCLRLRARGLRVIHTPEAVVVHHEWTSRKTYYDMVDRMLLLDRWEPLIEKGDPYYNPNLNLERGDYSLATAS